MVDCVAILKWEHYTMHTQDLPKETEGEGWTLFLNRFSNFISHFNNTHRLDFSCYRVFWRKLPTVAHVVNFDTNKDMYAVKCRFSVWRTEEAVVNDVN